MKKYKHIQTRLSRLLVFFLFSFISFFNAYSSTSHKGLAAAFSTNGERKQLSVCTEKVILSSGNFIAENEDLFYGFCDKEDDDTDSNDEDGDDEDDCDSDNDDLIKHYDADSLQHSFSFLISFHTFELNYLKNFVSPQHAPFYILYKNYKIFVA